MTKDNSSCHLGTREASHHLSLQGAQECGGRPIGYQHLFRRPRQWEHGVHAGLGVRADRNGWVERVQILSRLRVPNLFHHRVITARNGGFVRG